MRKRKAVTVRLDTASEKEQRVINSWLDNQKNQNQSLVTLMVHAINHLGTEDLMSYDMQFKIHTQGWNGMLVDTPEVYRVAPSVTAELVNPAPPKEQEPEAPVVAKTVESTPALVEAPAKPVEPAETAEEPPAVPQQPPVEEPPVTEPAPVSEPKDEGSVEVNPDIYNKFQT